MRFDEGEILVRGPNIAPRRSTPTAGCTPVTSASSTITGGCESSDARSDTIVSGGENVAPAEVEAVLLEHPGGRRCRRFSRSRRRVGERVVATVVLRDGQPVTPGGAAGVRQRERLARFKVPKEIGFSEQLPRNCLRQASAPQVADGWKTFEETSASGLLDSWEEAAKGWGRQADRDARPRCRSRQWMIAHAQLAARTDGARAGGGARRHRLHGAARIKPGGTLISSDAVAGMLDVARERAEEQGVDNVEFKQLQLEWIDLPTASVDVDPVSVGRDAGRRPGCRAARVPARAEARRALRFRGLGSRRSRTRGSTIPQRALVDLGHVEPPTAGGPGMFALADRAGSPNCSRTPAFFDVEIEPVPIPRTTRA